MDRHIPHIAIEGCIGVGKTTMAAAVAKRLGFTAILERVDWNPVLQDLYDNPLDFRIQAMITFLCIHYHQLQLALLKPEEHAGMVSDYLFARERIFAQTILRDLDRGSQERRTIDCVYELFVQRLPTPDVVVYIAADPWFLMERVRHRDRPAEQALTLEYLTALADGYEEFFRTYRDCPVIRLNATEMDLRCGPAALDALTNDLRKRYVS